MIKLFGFGSAYGVADASPFVMKIDTYLRLAGLEFERVNKPTNLFKAPKGKLPFIHDGDQCIADSFFIVEYLKDKYGVNLDAHLSDEEKAKAHLVSKAIEEHLYWILVYSRWIREDTWPQVKQNFFGGMPPVLKQVAPAFARKGVKDSLKKQGLGRHSDAEIKQMLVKELDSLSNLLGGKPFFGGDQPCSLDAVAFSCLAQFIVAAIDNEFNTVARGYETLVRYCETMQKALYLEASNKDPLPSNAA